MVRELFRVRIEFSGVWVEFRVKAQETKDTNLGMFSVKAV